MLLSSAIACATGESLDDDRNGNGGSTNAGGETAANGGSASGGASGAAQGGAATGAGGASKGGTTSAGGATTTAGGATTTAGGASKGGATGSGGATTVSTGGAKSTGPSGSQLFLDDFEDGDFTGPGDMNWIQADTNGTWSVAMQSGSNALTVAGSSKTFSVSGNAAWTDQKVSAKVMIVAGTSTIAYLQGRWASTKDFIVIEYRVGTASSPKGDLKLRVNAAGSTDDICRFKPTSALPNEWHTIGFAVKGGAGSALTLYFDDQPVTADVPCVLIGDMPPLAGGIAVGVASGTAAFDNVTVSVP